MFDTCMCAMGCVDFCNAIATPCTGATAHALSGVQVVIHHDDRPQSVLI